MGTGRIGEASRLVREPTGTPAAPQWHIIERITSGEVLASIGEIDTAATVFADGVQSAERHRLPHQIQRAIRATEKAGMRELAIECSAALERIRSQLSGDK